MDISLRFAARVATCVAGAAVALVSYRSFGGESGGGPAPAIAVESIGRPVSHANLSVVFLRGRETAPGRLFLTLQEGLRSGRVIIHETSHVNELLVENRSDRDLFIQAGEIVRGGKQDRLLATDLLVRPKSGRVPIESYCVEQGRWRQRGSEAAGVFSSSENYAPSNAIKYAAKVAADQGAVWSGVGAAQQQLSAGVGQSVRSPVSASSLELTLEQDAIRDRAAEYVGALANAVDSERDAIGVAFAINGEFYSADLYGSADLLRQLWPKLLRAAAVQALAMKKDDGAHAAPSDDQVRAFLDDAAGAAATVKDLPVGVRLITRETPRQARFETIDTLGGQTLLHINCLKAERDAAVRSFESDTIQPIRRR